MVNKTVDWWGFVAGLGLFLFGMLQVEGALRILAGRRFKKFLRRQTSHPLRSIMSGTAATAMLQSSSVVGLMVLAFVGARIITMRNALGVIFGSNLGTTLTGWLIVLVGFKLNIQAAALPLVAVGTLGLVFFREQPRASAAFKILVGAGFVLMGLDFMKSSVGALSQTMDLSVYAEYSALVFVLVGFVFTAIIQSSSATIMVTLTALNAGIISLEQSLAIVIGADVGSTITIILGSIKGSGSKKRVALAHFLFNFITGTVAYILLQPLQYFITNVVGIQDPLIATVFFHTMFNVIGNLIFYPIIGPFARFLEQRFVRPEDETASRYVSKATVDVADAAIEALENEAAFMFDEVVALNLKIAGAPPLRRLNSMTPEEASFISRAPHERGYEHIKELEGEILEFGAKLQMESLEKAEADRLQQLLIAIRNAVHSSKCLKDVRQDFTDFEQSANDYLLQYLGHFRDAVVKFYKDFQAARARHYPEVVLESLVELVHENNAMHEWLHQDIQREVIQGHFSEVEISTLLNVNRELYSSNKALILALKDLALAPEKAADFEALPGAT